MICNALSRSPQRHMNATWQGLYAVAQQVLWRLAHEEQGAEADVAPQREEPARASDAPPTKPLGADELELLQNIVRDRCFHFGTIDAYDDLLQDMVVEVLRLDLLARFDPTKGCSLPSYMWRFVHHRFINLYQKESRHRHRVEALDESEADSGEEIVLPDPWLLAHLEQIAWELQLHYSPVSGIYYQAEPFAPLGLVSWNHYPRAMGHDQIVWRDHATIFRLLCMGLQQREIAGILYLSNGNTCHRVDDIRAWPGVQELQTVLHRSL